MQRKEKGSKNWEETDDNDEVGIEKSQLIDEVGAEKSQFNDEDCIIGDDGFCDLKKFKMLFFCFNRSHSSPISLIFAIATERSPFTCFQRLSPSFST